MDIVTDTDIIILAVLNEDGIHVFILFGECCIGLSLLTLVMIMVMKRLRRADDSIDHQDMYYYEPPL